MKKILFLLLLSLGSNAQTVHRVTNGENLSALITAANEGEIFLIEPGEYGTLSIDKEVKVYGTGYFLDINDPSYNGTSNFSNVYIRPSAIGSQISGLNVSGVINVAANQSIVTRCKSSLLRIGYEVNNEVHVSNVLISQNYTDGINVYADSENFIIRNNLIKGGFQYNTVNHGEVNNNSFGIGLSISGYLYSGTNFVNVIFKNNIFYRQYSSFAGPHFIRYVKPFITKNNLFDNTFGDPISLSSSNKVIADFSNVFVGAPSNPSNLQEDARYQLSQNSPARGAGENGTDCGAFGGDDPYVLSGKPNIPSIYQLTIPSQVPQNGVLNVQIKAKTNN